MTEAKAIRNSVEGRDVPRGPSASELHKRTIQFVCVHCNGTGRQYGAHCTVCDGRGTIASVLELRL